MKTVSIFRIVLIFTIALFLIEFLGESTSGRMVLIEQPIMYLILGVVLLFAIAMELCVAAIRRLLFSALSDEAKKRYIENESAKTKNIYSGIRKKYLYLIGSRPIEEEAEIILDHDYDGIKELDNNLPPWWIWGFYATIVFAVVYMARYHIFEGVSQDEEYRIEVAEATQAINEYRKTAKGLVDAGSVVVLTEVEDLRNGESIFVNSCAACHRSDGGGGIGPNLTDNHWILGGAISDVFNVISEGGRPGKGMIAWKQDLKPLEIAQVASYVLSLQNTNPPDPKDPEGDLFESELPIGKTDNLTINTEETDLGEILDRE